MREWFYTAQAMIEFRRNLVQALDIKGPQLLQVPHFNEDILKHVARGKNACNTLVDFMARDADAAPRVGAGSVEKRRSQLLCNPFRQVLARESARMWGADGGLEHERLFSSKRSLRRASLFVLSTPGDIVRMLAT